MEATSGRRASNKTASFLSRSSMSGASRCISQGVHVLSLNWHPQSKVTSNLPDSDFGGRHCTVRIERAPRGSRSLACTTTTVITLALSLLAGCSGTTIWTHPEGTAGFKRDSWECVRDSRTYGGGSGLIGAVAILGAQAQANALYAQCLESKGYIRN